MEEKQTLTITFVFNTKHNPGTPEHLSEVLRNTLAPKGIQLLENNLITI